MPGMASRTIVELTDDIDGKPAAETVRFGLDGREYEIDLSEKNAKALRKAFEPWAEASPPRRRPPQPRHHHARRDQCRHRRGTGVGSQQRHRTLLPRPTPE